MGSSLRGKPELWKGPEIVRVQECPHELELGIWPLEGAGAGGPSGWMRCLLGSEALLPTRGRGQRTEGVSRHPGTTASDVSQGSKAGDKGVGREVSGSTWVPRAWGAWAFKHMWSPGLTIHPLLGRQCSEHTQLRMDFKALREALPSVRELHLEDPSPPPVSTRRRHHPPQKRSAPGSTLRLLGRALPVWTSRLQRDQLDRQARKPQSS